MSYLTGHRMSNALEKMYGVKIILPAEGGSGEVIIEGSSKETIFAAMRYIRGKLPNSVLKFFIGKEHFGLIIGNKGKNIRKLKKNLKVKIDIHNGRMTERS